MIKMYKKVKKDCEICRGTGTYDKQVDFGFFNTYRCRCTKRKTKKYKKALEKCYDNNAQYQLSEWEV